MLKSEEIESDMQYLYKWCEDGGIEKTADNMFRQQTKNQYHQYTVGQIRHWLDGQPMKLGRPKERTGNYERITLEIRKDLLQKMDRLRGKRSRREYVETLLEG